MPSLQKKKGSLGLFVGAEMRSEKAREVFVGSITPPPHCKKNDKFYSLHPDKTKCKKRANIKKRRALSVTVSQVI